MEENGYKVCPNCGQRIRASAVKCRFCGKWLEEPYIGPVPGETKGAGEGEVHLPGGVLKMEIAPVIVQVAVESASSSLTPAGTGAPTDERDSKTAQLPNTPRKPAEGYVERHWRGKLSLGISFWVNCLLLCVGYVAAFSAVAQVGIAFSMWLAIPIVIVMFMWFIAVTCWQVVGTWRSAEKHAGRGGTQAVAVLAKVVMVIWVLAAGKSLAVDWVSLGAGIWKGIQSTRTIPVCQVRVLPGGKAVEMYGGLPPGSAAKLDALLRATPEAMVVYVNSIGGLIREGQKAGQIIRQRGLSTYTEGCASAATLIFISGKERTIKEGAKVGFHAPEGFGMWAEEKTLYDSMVRETMTEAGVTQDFITRVLATPNKELWFPTVEEMRRANVITKEDAPLKTVATSVLSMIENGTNVSAFVPVKTGHAEIDQLMGFVGPFFGRWARLFSDMTSELDKAGEVKLYTDRTLGAESGLRHAIALEQKRQQIIERYRTISRQEVDVAKSNLAAMNFSEETAKGMLKGMTNSIEKGRLQAEDLFGLRLRTETDREKFLSFMLERFSTYRLREGKISFGSQADSDQYEALASAVSKSDKQLEDFTDKMLKTAGSAKEQLKKATE